MSMFVCLLMLLKENTWLNELFIESRQVIETSVSFHQGAFQQEFLRQPSSKNGAVRQQPGILGRGENSVSYGGEKAHGRTALPITTKVRRSNIWDSWSVVAGTPWEPRDQWQWAFRSVYSWNIGCNFEASRESPFLRVPKIGIDWMRFIWILKERLRRGWPVLSRTATRNTYNISSIVIGDTGCFL